VSGLYCFPKLLVKKIKKRKTGQVWNLKPNGSQTYKFGKSQPAHVVKNGE
jgi:hypothetical protein